MRGVINQVLPTPEEEALARMPGEETPKIKIQTPTGAGLAEDLPRPGGEEGFLRSLFEFTRSAQQHPDRSIALAARRWERSLRFRVAVTRQQQQRRRPLAAGQPSLN